MRKYKDWKWNYAKISAMLKIVNKKLNKNYTVNDFRNNNINALEVISIIADEFCIADIFADMKIAKETCFLQNDSETCINCWCEYLEKREVENKMICSICDREYNDNEEGIDCELCNSYVCSDCTVTCSKCNQKVCNYCINDKNLCDECYFEEK